jgi:hypothetical protein
MKYSEIIHKKIILAAARIMCGPKRLKTRRSGQTSEIHTFALTRCNLLRLAVVMLFWIASKCRTALRLDATGTMDSKDHIILLAP